MIPFEIPGRFVNDVATRILRRIGTTLRDSKTGQIVAHLQETRLLQDLSGGLVSPGPHPATLLLSAARLGSSVWANVQLQQVKDMLHTLGMLNAATLAASVVGIGVSSAGFALVLQRLQRVEHVLQAVHRDVREGRRFAERADLRLAASHRAVVDSLLCRADEAWHRSDIERVWRELDGPLDQEQRYYRQLLGGQGSGSIFLHGSFSFEEAVAAYEAVLTLAAVRIQVLLLIEEQAAALHHAEEFHRWHDSTLQRLRPIDIATARSRELADREGIREEDARARLLRWSESFMDGVREAQLAVADRPGLLCYLRKRGIRGRDYVEALREQRDHPMLVLPIQESRP
jgi:hypothetical protein